MAFRLFNPITEVDAPPPRNYGSEISQILGQYGGVAQAQFNNASQFNPQYQQLALGMYGQALPTINSILNQANSATRTSTAGDLAALGPGFTDSLRSLNPSQTQLYDKLVRSANEGLDAGTRLTPDQSYRVSAPIRADWAGRGFGESLPGDLDSAVALSRAGDNMLGQRQAFAAGVAEQGNRFYTQPTIASILGTGSNAAGVAGPLSASATPPDTFGGLMGYGSDLFNTNYNAEAAARIATANNEAGIVSSLLSY